MHEKVKRTIVRAVAAGLMSGVILTALLVLTPVSLGAAPPETGSSGTASPITAAHPAVTVPAQPTVIVPGSTIANGAPPAPQLSIAVDNGHTSAAVGDAFTYTITVANLGTTDIPGLVVTQTMPTGLTFGSADSGGTAESDSVTWNVDLKATDTSTFHTTMSVVPTPADLLRLATVACASLSPGGSPIVCASHSDQLPAGAAAESSQAAAAADTAAAPPTGPGLSWWWIGGGIGLVIVAALAMGIIILRNRSASPVDHHADKQEVQSDEHTESESETEPDQQNQTEPAAQPEEPDEPETEPAAQPGRPAARVPRLTAAADP